MLVAACENFCTVWVVFICSGGRDSRPSSTPVVLRTRSPTKITKRITPTYTVDKRMIYAFVA